MDGDEIEIDLTEEDMKLQQEVTDQTVPEKAAALCAESSPGQPMKPKEIEAPKYRGYETVNFAKKILEEKKKRTELTSKSKSNEKEQFEIRAPPISYEAALAKFQKAPEKKTQSASKEKAKLKDKKRDPAKRPERTPPMPVSQIPIPPERMDVEPPEKAGPSPPKPPPSVSEKRSEQKVVEKEKLTTEISASIVVTPEFLEDYEKTKKELERMQKQLAEVAKKDAVQIQKEVVQKVRQPEQVPKAKAQAPVRKSVPQPTKEGLTYATPEEALEARKARRRIRRRENRKMKEQENRQKLLAKISAATEAIPILAENTANRSMQSVQSSSASVTALVENMDIVENVADIPFPIHPTPANVLQDDMDPDEFDEFDSFCIDDEDKGITSRNFPLSGKPSKKSKKKLEDEGLEVPVPIAPGSQTDLPKPLRETHYEFDAKDTALKFHIIKDKWVLLERELMLSDIFRDSTFRNMPSTSVREVAHLIRGSTILQATNEKLHDICSRVYINEAPGLSDDVKDFINVIECTRVLSINTEGTKYMMKDRKGTLIPRVMITFGSFDGRVMFFNRHDIVPKQLINFIEDPKYTKIGSGLEKEFAEFARVGIQMHNWVEIGCLRMALYPPAWDCHKEIVQNYRANSNFSHIDIETGIKGMIRDLKRASCFPAEYKRTDWDYRWEGIGSRINKDLKYYGKPPPKMMPHIRENARIPFAELILIVDHFARNKGYNLDQEPFWPIAYEAMDLCRLKDPKVFQANIEKDYLRNNWLFHVDQGDGVTRAALPATCTEMLNNFKARVDFREPYFIVRLEVAANVIYRRFWPENGTGIEFPKYGDIGVVPPEELIKLRCASCGKEDHKIQDCPINKHPVCEYPHDNVEYGAHSTLCCPHLHKYCKHCQLLGHHQSVHWTPAVMVTFRELRKRFFENFHRGLLTSIPLLALHPEGRKKIQCRHWRFAFDNKRFHQSVIERFAMGIVNAKVNDGWLGTQRKNEDLKEFRLHKDYQLEVIRNNVKKTELPFYKFPRDLVKRFDFKMADIDSIKEENEREAERVLEEARQKLKRNLQEISELEEKAKKARLDNGKPS